MFLFKAMNIEASIIDQRLTSPTVRKVVHVHRPAQLIGDGPEGVAELLAEIAHGLVGAGLVLQAEIRSASRGLSLLNWLTPRMLNPIT